MHFLLNVPGFRPLITHLFEEGAEFLDSDVVFGTKQELVVGYEHHDPGPTPDGGTQRRAVGVGDLRLRAAARMTMRAVELHSPGEPPAVVDRADPVPGPGEVLVRVTAAPITPLDLLCASGTSYFGVPRTPYVPGVQGVGTVDGAAVWFPMSAGMAPGDGSMAEAAAVPSADLVTLPAGAEPTEIAALGLSAIAAHMALTWRGELAPGETVVVLGAGGVVGQAAVQLARLNGAERVVAAARSHEGQQRALAAGADAVVALDTDDVARAGRTVGRGGRRTGGPGARPAVRRTGSCRGQVPAAGRPAGQPRRLRLRARAARLLDDPQPLAAGARLHEQRADPRAEGGRDDRGRATCRRREPRGRARGGRRSRMHRTRGFARPRGARPDGWCSSPDTPPYTGSPAGCLCTGRLSQSSRSLAT